MTQFVTCTCCKKTYVKTKGFTRIIKDGRWVYYTECKDCRAVGMWGRKLEQLANARKVRYENLHEMRV